MNKLSIALQYLPYILSSVKGVEQVLGDQPGAVKKQLVMSAITAACKVGEQVPEVHVQVVSYLIDVVVQTLNTTGVFAQKKTLVSAQTAAQNK